MKGKLIYETENFVVEAVQNPLVTRMDGGHIKISPKVKIVDRTELSSKLAIELMRLTMVVGEAMTIAMNKRGIDIGRINYQDNGNWSVNKPEGPYFHIHIYGRAKSAKIQKWGEALFMPLRETNAKFYEKNESLNDGDIEETQKQIKIIFGREKYSDKNWSLK